MAGDGDLRGLQGEARWQSRSRQPCGSGVGPGQAALLELGEFQGRRPGFRAATALETWRGRPAGLPGSQLPRRLARTLELRSARRARNKGRRASRAAGGAQVPGNRRGENSFTLFPRSKRISQRLNLGDRRPAARRMLNTS